MLQSGVVNVNFMFGVTIEIIDIPQESLIQGDKLYYISGFEQSAYENVYLNNNTFWTMPPNYFKNWRLELWGNHEGKFQKIYQHCFNLTGENVLFDLHPNSQHEADVWVEYLKYFAKVKGCNIFLTNSNKYTQSTFPTGDGGDGTFYAGYLINWSEDRYINPYGNKFNPFDLINKKLLNI